MNPSKCRFCGSETAPHLHSTQDPDVTRKAYWICCRQSSLGCGACGPVRDSEEEAVKTWNAPYKETTYRYRHLKTGNIYILVGIAINATNAQDGQGMILYTKENDSVTYAREENEFLEKFERLPE